MTCIVGLENEEGAWIGADSAAVSGSRTRTTENPKVFQVGPFTCGFTTSFRMGQMLQYDILPVLKPGTVKDPMAWAVAHLIPAVRLFFRDAGYSKIEHNVQTGGKFLLGIQGSLLQIDSDFQVQRYQDGLYALGSGSEFALGALHVALRDDDLMSPKYAITAALSAAATFSGSVTPPFRVLSV